MFPGSGMRLKHELVAMQLATACAVLFVYAAFTLFSTWRASRGTEFSRMDSAANLLGASSVSALDFMDPEAARKVLASLEAQPDVTDGWIYDSQGRLFAGYSRAGKPVAAPAPAGNAWAVSGGQATISRSILRDGELLGTILLRSDMGRYRRAMTRDSILALFMLLAALGLALLLSLRMQRAISDPILRLMEAVRRVTQTGMYTVRVDPRGSYETAALCRSFNDMIAEIEKREVSLQEAQKVLEARVRERTAELEKAAEAARSADRLKSAFLATMSHELRTPLNCIIGFTGILLQELPGGLNGEQKKQLGMVKESADHLLALINDVLDISKIEAGELQVSAEPFDLRAAVEKASLTAQPLAQRKGLSLETDITSEVGTVVGDRRRVEQVLLNLLSNAVKFTDEGSVRVACSLVGDRAAIRIADTGIGIRPEDLKSLFQPFRQIDTGISRQYEGTGLGLSICKRLLELMGGSIRAESEWGKGSVFIVSLPTRRGRA